MPRAQPGTRNVMLASILQPLDQPLALSVSKATFALRTMLQRSALRATTAQVSIEKWLVRLEPSTLRLYEQLKAIVSNALLSMRVIKLVRRLHRFLVLRDTTVVEEHRLESREAALKEPITKDQCVVLEKSALSRAQVPLAVRKATTATTMQCLWLLICVRQAMFAWREQESRLLCVIQASTVLKALTQRSTVPWAHTVRVEEPLLETTANHVLMALLVPLKA